MLNKVYGKPMTTFISQINLDGLIFASIDTLYTIGSWNRIMTTQYKWKPSIEQTVDLLMKLNGNRVELFVKIGKSLVKYEKNYKAVTVPKPQFFTDNTIGSIINTNISKQPPRIVIDVFNFINFLNNIL